MAHLTIITGPMFSGKSAELIRIAKRLDYAKKKTLALKPISDTRQNSIRTRAVKNGQSIVIDQIKAIEISSPAQMQDIITLNHYDALLIDEVHFFEDWIIEELFKLYLNSTKPIYAAGLDKTAWGDSFGPIGPLLSMADKVIKLNAVCFQCGADATMTFKHSSGNNVVEVGDAGLYEARCRNCWEQPK